MTLPAAAHTTTAAADDLVALFKASQAEHDNLRHEHAATQRRLKDAEAALHEREQTVKHQEAAAKRSSELIASLRETVQTYIGACALQAEAATDHHSSPDEARACRAGRHLPAHR